MEAFSGKTAKAVKQDFHAKVFMMTMCAAYAHLIEEKVVAEYKADEARKHRQKINRTNALATVMDMAISMFLKRKFRESMDAFDDVVYNTRELVRPGRREARSKKPRKTHHMTCKPL